MRFSEMFLRRDEDGRGLERVVYAEGGLVLEIDAVATL
jgi:hypothetical protein